jgi:hypothetical protein
MGWELAPPEGMGGVPLGGAQKFLNFHKIKKNQYI